LIAAVGLQGSLALSAELEGAATLRSIRVLALVEATALTGIGRGLLSFAAAQDGQLDAVSLALLIVARRATRDVPLARRALHAGLPVFLLPERRRFDPLTIRHLRGICTRWQPDVVQTHAVKSHALVRLSGLRREHTWIAFHHGYTYPDLKMRVYNTFDRFTLRHAHHVVAVAEAFRGELVRCGVEESRLSVLHNAAPTWSPENQWGAASLRARLQLAPDTRVVAAVGRLSFEKGHLDLIRAFARVRAQVPDLHLVIAGEGPEHARLRREIVGLRLEQQVTLLGALDDVSPVYRQATRRPALPTT